MSEDNNGWKLLDLENRLTVVEQKLEKLEKKPKSKSKTQGAQVFEAFSHAYSKRYNTEPIRNAAVNRQASELVKRVGLDNAKKLVQFYVWQNDAFFVKNYHDLKFCLNSCQALMTRMQTGNVVSDHKAKKTERMGQGVSASQSYLQRKHGGQDGSDE